MDKTQKIKIGVAAGALVAAALLVAWNFGVFGQSAPEPGITDEDVPEERLKDIEEQNQRDLEEWKNAPSNEKGGA